MNNQIHQEAEPRMREALSAMMCLAGPIRTRASKLNEARQIFAEEVLPALATSITFGDSLHAWHGQAMDITMELKSILSKLQAEPELVRTLISKLNSNHDTLDGYKDVLEDARKDTEDTVEVIKDLSIGIELAHITLYDQAAVLEKHERGMNNAYHLLADFEA